jgi:hypothetical protein
MIERQDIITEIEKELGYLLAEASEGLSEKARKAIREDALRHTQRVLDALTIQELQSAGAYNRFLENTLAQARMRMHLR